MQFTKVINSNANTYNPRESGAIQAVALTPVYDSYYDDFTLEPPMVRMRSGNNAYLYLSSTDIGTKDIPPTKCQISSVGAGILTRKAKKMGLVFFKFHHDTPVINSSNNELLIYSAADDNVYRITIPQGDWNTPQLLMSALRVGLENSVNAITGVSSPNCNGITFNMFFKGYTPYPVGFTIPLVNSKCALVATSPVYFLPQSSAIKYGNSTFGWSVVAGTLWPGGIVLGSLQVEYISKCFTTMMIGPMPCTYTRYIDIFSFSLTKWSKLTTGSSKSGPSSLIYRLYLDSFIDYPTNPGVITIGPPGMSYSPIIYIPNIKTYTSNIANPITFTLNPEENLTTIDFDFRDEYGNEFVVDKPIYSYETTPGDPSTKIYNITPSNYNGGFIWDMVLRPEL